MSILNTLKSKLMPGRKAETATDPIRFSQETGSGAETETQQMTCAESMGKKLVVATLDSKFTEDMVDYALEMAQRMDYGIIAVNAANLTHDVTEFFSTSHEELFQDFQETAVRHVEPFKQKALEKGLQFAHTTKYSDIDHAIAEITSKCQGVEFIITENKNPAPVRGSVSPDNRIAQRLFVYAVD